MVRVKKKKGASHAAAMGGDKLSQTRGLGGAPEGCGAGPHTTPTPPFGAKYNV